VFLARFTRRLLSYIVGVAIGFIPLAVLYVASAPPSPFFLATLALHFDTIMCGIAFLAMVTLMLRPKGHWSRWVGWGVISAAIIAMSGIYALTTAIPL